MLAVVLASLQTLFAPDFDIIHLLDPSPLNHEKAQIFLGPWVKHNRLRTKLEYTQSTAEEGHKLVKDADLVICAEAAHFIDPDSLVASAARMLRPTGTLAIYSYWVPTFPDQSKMFSDTFCRAVTQTLGLCIRPGDEDNRVAFCKSIARASAGKGVLDSIPVPDEYFEDVQRIRINTDAEEVMHTFKKSFPVGFEPIPSRVSNNEKGFSYESGKDPQAEGWCFSVDNQWLHNFMDTMRPSDVKLSQEKYQSIYGEWDSIFADECQSGWTRALWPVNILLGTRR